MNFLALIVGLALERLLTRLFHLRAFQWLNPLFTSVWERARNAPRNTVYVFMLLLPALLVVPVALVELGLQNRLAYVPEFVFAVVILVICLGPRDLIAEVADYREALAADDPDGMARVGSELLEQPLTEPADIEAIETAIYAQSCNRIFGVVFWFICFGAAGAWLFRVVDLMRQHAVRQALADPAGLATLPVAVVSQVHRILAWIPSRLLMIGYTLGGSYEGATQAWKESRPNHSVSPAGVDAWLLGQVGRAAAGTTVDMDDDKRIETALNLVIRTLWMIWCPILALLTLYDWIN